MKNSQLKDSVMGFIHEEINLRGKSERNGKISYGNVMFPLESNRQPWQILKEDYSYLYHQLVDEIFDEVHPY